MLASHRQTTKIRSKTVRSDSVPTGSSGRSRVSRIALVVAVLLGTVDTLAQTAHSRLGTPEVQSSLGSPLWVKIPIQATEAGEDVSASRFMLGARPLNSALPFLESGEIGFERVGDKYFLAIRSRQSIDEPVIGLVIREQIPNGVRSREFTLLLDPPSLAPVRLPDGTAQNQTATNSMFLAAQAVQTIATPKTSIATLTPVPATTQPGVAPESLAKPARKRPSRPLIETNTPSMPSSSATNVPPIQPNAGPASERMARPANRRTRAVQSTGDGLRLTLSLGEGLNQRTTASEAERAVLRMRHMMLDMDDLTASLLERQNRISQLEKELAGLVVRVSAAERVIAGGALVDGKLVAATSATSNQAPALAPAQSIEQAPANKTMTPSMTTPANAPAKVAPTSRSTPIWQWSLIGAVALAGLFYLIGKLRSVLNRRDESYRLVPQQADDYVAEALARSESAAPAPANATTIRMVVPATAAPASAKAAAIAEAPAIAVPEIHFELPEIPPQTHEVGQQIQLADDAFAFGAGAMSAPGEHAVADDLRSRRMRYLQSRYQDIAILMPPIDAPQRLLKQAGTVYDEGAAEFAKRLLKFAAYSRPYAEDFWLALLELLYREKIAGDYIVNAKWFHQYLPDSSHWNEVVRIGYLLDAAEPLFTAATHWSHEEPTVGIWLPSAPVEQRPASPLPHLTLELAN